MYFEYMLTCTTWKPRTLADVAETLLFPRLVLIASRPQSRRHLRSSVPPLISLGPQDGLIQLLQQVALRRTQLQRVLDWLHQWLGPTLWQKAHQQLD